LTRGLEIYGAEVLCRDHYLALAFMNSEFKLYRTTIVQRQLFQSASSEASLLCAVVTFAAEMEEAPVGAEASLSCVGQILEGVHPVIQCADWENVPE
jgi:hypothetical protein